MQTTWHHLQLEDIYKTLDSSKEGLSSTEAAKRLKSVGPNELPVAKQEPMWRLFLSQFNSPLMYVMLVAIGISYALGDIVDGGFIVVVVLINTAVGFYQEFKANKSLSSLKRYIKQEARVLRDSKEQEVTADRLVPGDIIALRAGEKIPADARIIECVNLKTSESVLTGEARPVEKKIEAVDVTAEVAKRFDMVFMGTLVEEGSGLAIVTATGSRTEYGDIVSLLTETQEEPTPLQHTVLSLSKIVGISISCIVAVVATLEYVFGHPLQEIFTSSLALFVSAIPEGILPAITIVLALGMERILRHRGLVRRLAATETLGGVTVICTDKTGTLTEGKMAVRELLTAAGEHTAESLKNNTHALSLRLIRGGIFSNDAYVEHPGAHRERIVGGSLTEQALLGFAERIGVSKERLNKEFPALDTVLFSSEYKYSASLRSMGKEGDVLFVLGAPEQLAERCAFIETVEGPVSIRGEAGKKLLDSMQQKIAAGLRVVGCAERTVPSSKKYGSLHELIAKLTLVGFIVLDDPIRPDVAEALHKTTAAGIKTVVITGDNVRTATAIVEKLGMHIAPDQSLQGHELDEMDERHLRKVVTTALLYARVSPRHKLRIVQALQKNGEVVAMLGDGVNDAPALKAADIGVAVGTEVDAAREVADLVLLDSSFATIVRSVEQGRIIFNNIRKLFLFLITQDFSQFFIFMVSVVLGLPLPLLAVQLLFVNLIESGLPSLALTTEEEKDGVMEQPPRNPKESILNRPAAIWMASIFCISGIIAFTFYVTALAVLKDTALTRTMMTLFMCLEPLLLAFSVRSLTRGVLRPDVFSNHWLVGAFVVCMSGTLLVIYTFPLQNILSLQPLAVQEVVAVVAVVACEILLLDFIKVHVFKRYSYPKYRP